MQLEFTAAASSKSWLIAAAKKRSSFKKVTYIVVHTVPLDPTHPNDGRGTPS